jgi:hypothetical protein
MRTSDFSVIAPQYGSHSGSCPSIQLPSIRAHKYLFLFETYPFFNLILIKISTSSYHFALVLYSFPMSNPILFPFVWLAFLEAAAAGLRWGAYIGGGREWLGAWWVMHRGGSSREQLSSWWGERCTRVVSDWTHRGGICEQLDMHRGGHEARWATCTTVVHDEAHIE